MPKLRKKKEAGFTLIEMLITVLILGVLAGAAVWGYVGYVKDAKTAEAKALIGSAWTSLQACAMSKPGTACTTAGQYGRLGLTAAGVTPDGRWTLTGGDASMAAATNILSLTEGAAGLKATGAKDALDIIVQMKYLNTDEPPSSFQCKIPPAATFSSC